MINIRILNESEIETLLECLNDLADHHNAVSTHFKGHYHPDKDFSKVLEKFREQVSGQISEIAVLECENEIIGFCKCDIYADLKQGKLDYLVIKKPHRGKGCGSMLMDWAMDFFSDKPIDKIEVKVVAGNDAIHLYEKYGFKMNAHLMWKV